MIVQRQTSLGWMERGIQFKTKLHEPESSSWCDSSLDEGVELSPSAAAWLSHRQHPVTKDLIPSNGITRE